MRSLDRQPKHHIEPRSVDAFVKVIWVYESYAPATPLERILPDGGVELVVPLSASVSRFGTGPGTGADRSVTGGVVCGPHLHSFLIDTSQPETVAGIHFRPGGAFPFFREPAGELFNQHVALEDLWGTGRNSQFVVFAQNILDRRFKLQQVVPGNSFNQYLAENLTPKELEAAYEEARKKFKTETKSLRNNIRYAEWMSAAEATPDVLDLNALVDLYTTRILIERDRSSRQLSLQLTPLSTEELEDRDSSSTSGAAEIFLNYELKVPYYFGTERVCSMATNNVEELLTLAAALYDGMKAKQILRRQADPVAWLEPFRTDHCVSKRRYPPGWHMDSS